MQTYPTPAPIFDGADYDADIIGHAKTEAEAVAAYVAHFSGTGSAPVTGARKIVMDPGSRDGWAPIFQD